MSEQLNHTLDSEIVYLDFSKKSIIISQIKTYFRKTNNTVWISSWIEDVPKLGIGLFDLITCTGVLHHLKSPQKGLNIMKNVQFKSGGAGVMVYGSYGRTGIYQIQELLRIIDMYKYNQSLHGEISNAREILRVLPEMHWFHHLKFSDHTTMGDIGIYDLLLHKRDIAFSISSLYDWIGNSTYNIVDFSLHTKTFLSPKVRIRDVKLYDIIIKGSIVHQRGILEVISGNVPKHDFYISNERDTEAIVEIDSTDIISIGSPAGFSNIINTKKNYKPFRNETFIFAAVASSFIDEDSDPSNPLEEKNTKLITDFVFPSTEFSKFVVARITRKPVRSISIRELMTTFKAKTGSKHTMKDLKKDFEDLFLYLKHAGVFLLKHKSVDPFPKTCCQNRFRVYSLNI